MVDISIEELVRNAFHARFPTQHDLASTFLRFQEHDESPKFKGTLFTLEEFKEWYVPHSPNGRATGQFTYYDDWTGFNIPSFVFDPFFEGKFDPLSGEEKQFLDLFEACRGRKFYVIGTYQDQELKHEIAHGLFYIDDEYQKRVLRALHLLHPDDRTKMEEQLLEQGYCHDVLDDEIHAYLLDETDHFEDTDVDRVRSVAARLKRNFDHAMNRNKV